MVVSNRNLPKTPLLEEEGWRLFADGVVRFFFATNKEKLSH